MADILIPIVLIALGLYFGKRNESRHYESIKQREARFKDKKTIPSKTPPPGFEIGASTIAVGSVVISVDYFKRFLATIVSFLGGELVSYSSLLDRARREAVLRMQESAPKADLYINVRIETSSIASGYRKNIGCVEAFCYATAVKRRKTEKPTNIPIPTP